MRVLILRANAIAPDPRVEKIGRALAAAGHAVTALGWDRAGDLPLADEAAGFPIRRLRVAAGMHRGLGNLPALARWQRGLLSWIGKRHTQFDIVHACDFDTLPAALAAKRLWGLKVVYDIFDFYADMLRATPRLVKGALRRADLLAIGQADAVILADDSRRSQIAGARPRRLAVVYNAPEDGLSALQAAALPSPAAKGVCLRLAYTGLLQVERGLLPLLCVLANHPEWTLDLAGQGAEKDLLVRQAAGMPNVTYHGVVAYRRALELAYAADALPAFYDPSIANHRYASPNKLFEGMMLARPVLAARNSGFDDLVERLDCGLVMDYGDTAQLEQALLRLQNRDLRQKLGENGRKAYEQTYSWAHMAARLAALYQEL
jgi:glycosyltransferase involved in cell wall biosynthesis